LNYITLYEAWKKEKEDSNLQVLNKGFYSEASALIRSQRDEMQILDERSLAAQLLAKQQLRAQKLLAELIDTRFKKILHLVLGDKPPNTELVTLEEASILNDIFSIAEEFKNLSKSLLNGRPYHSNEEHTTGPSKKMIVRFLQNIPSIVGSNTRIYGPFKAEDIATLPIDNAESLIKRGIALKVEVQ
jgi:DNA replication factor GINS